jgi:predicted aldo/keto reductase-like oxidoreductase
MRTVRLGRTGLEVSVIGFGGIPIQRVSEAEAIRVVRRALDLGIDWIDTANGYTVSEERIGKALEGYDRSRIVIFTKSGARDPATLKENIELSLQRLRTDYLDCVQLHGVSDLGTWEKVRTNGCLDLLAEFKARGVVRHIGISSHTLEPALAEMEHPLIETMQFPFNFISHDISVKVLAQARRFDTGIIAMKPFGGGMIPHIDVCLRYLLQFPDVAPDPGFERVEEVEEVVRIVEGIGAFTEEDRERIASAMTELGPRFCRRCEYCGPCPQGVSIVPVMTVESVMKRLPKGNVVGGWVSSAVASHDKCTDCGECETKCPYKLPIREMMRENAAKFKAYAGT